MVFKPIERFKLLVIGALLTTQLFHIEEENLSFAVSNYQSVPTVDGNCFDVSADLENEPRPALWFVAHVAHSTGVGEFVNNVVFVLAFKDCFRRIMRRSLLKTAFVVFEDAVRRIGVIVRLGF